MRALFEFAKRPRLRFMSHLDLQRFMQLALRRTELPVAYSQGFNPHPLINFASALAMGWTSDCEVVDIKMAKDITVGFATEQMASALPPDLPLGRVRLVPDDHPKLMAQLVMADYQIELSGDGAKRVASAIPGFLDETEVIALRKTKSGAKPTNIRPMSVLLDSKQTEVCVVLNTRLMLTEAETLKPDLLVSVLSERAGLAEPPEMRIRRTHLLGLKDKQPHDLFAL